MLFANFAFRLRRNKRGEAMLFIRSEQMTSLYRSAFRHRLQVWARQFRKELSAQTQGYSDGELEAMLGLGASAAQEYGLVADFHVREYLRAILVTGADEDGRPRDAALRAAVEESGSGLEKLDRLAILVPDPDAAAQDRIALEEAKRNHKGSVETSTPNEEPERRVEPGFLVVDGREAPSEPVELEL
jgi:hypothetical protein